MIKSIAINYLGYHKPSVLFVLCCPAMLTLSSTKGKACTCTRLNIICCHPNFVLQSNQAFRFVLDRLLLYLMYLQLFIFLFSIRILCERSGRGLEVTFLSIININCSVLPLLAKDGTAENLFSIYSYGKQFLVKA